MPAAVNELGQLVGEPIAWAPLPPLLRASAARIAGRYCALEPLDAAAHGAALAAAWAQTEPASWTYLWAEKPATPAASAALLAGFAATDDPLHYAVVDAARGGAAVGSLALMRVDCAHGCVEVGHVNFTSPLIARSRVATEAVALLLGHAFALGFRRVEWKCDALNAPSVRAAARYGFRAEGVFKQHMVVKGRLRDTAWFALLRDEWAAAHAALARWLDAGNFDAEGRQRVPLGALRGAGAAAAPPGAAQ